MRVRAGHTPHETVDLLAAYAAEAASEPLLSAAEERELGVRVRAGDAAARDRFVRANLRLALGCTRGIAPGDAIQNRLDLIQEANAALVRAVDGWCPDRGLRFSTYAVPAIRRAIQRARDRGRTTIHLPEHLAGRCRELRRCRSALEQGFGREPTADELAESVGLSAQQVAAALRAEGLTWVLSLDVLAGGIEDGDELGAFVAAAAEDSDTGDQVGEWLDGLSETERELLALRYLGGGARLAEAAGEMGISFQRASRIERRALQRLRDRQSARVVA